MLFLSANMCFISALMHGVVIFTASAMPNKITPQQQSTEQQKGKLHAIVTNGVVLRHRNCNLLQFDFAFSSGEWLGDLQRLTHAKCRVSPGKKAK